MISKAFHYVREARHVDYIVYDLIHMEFLEKAKHFSGCLEREVGVGSSERNEGTGVDGSILNLECVILRNYIKLLKSHQNTHLNWENFSVWKWYFNKAFKK